MLQLSVPFFLEDTPGCLAPPPVLSRGEVFILVAVSLRKESKSEGDRCRTLPFLGLFSPNGNILTALHTNFCRFLTFNFSHTLPLKKLLSRKTGDSLLQKGCFVIHIHHPCMTFSSNLLSPQIKTHTRLQAQIGICKSSRVLSTAHLPPGTQRPAVVICVGVNTSLSPVAGSAYPSRRLSP